MRTPDGSVVHCSRRLVELSIQRRGQLLRAVGVDIQPFPHPRAGDIRESLIDQRRGLAALSVDDDSVCRGALRRMTCDGIAVIDVHVLAAGQSRGSPRVHPKAHGTGVVNALDSPELTIGNAGGAIGCGQLDPVPLREVSFSGFVDGHAAKPARVVLRLRTILELDLQCVVASIDFTDRGVLTGLDPKLATAFRVADDVTFVVPSCPGAISARHVLARHEH